MADPERKTTKSVAKADAKPVETPKAKPKTGRAKATTSKAKPETVHAKPKNQTSSRAKPKNQPKPTKRATNKELQPVGQDLPPRLVPVVEHILHGELDRTFPEVIAEAGLTPEEGILLWRVLGFDDSSAEGVVFNKYDVEAVKAFKRASKTEILTTEDMFEITRAIAQTTSRLADWQITIVSNRLTALGSDAPDGNPSTEDLVKVVDEIKGLRPILERLLIQIWRRQSVDHILRSERAQVKDEAASDVATVAFADMVGFTRISRELTNDQLAKLVERFEQVVTLIAAESGVKLMKTIGDEVLIMSDFPQDVAEFALRLQYFTETTEDFPELRIGVATGTVIPQMGDIFGETVNYASRLTAFAKPSSIYVDEATQEALAGEQRYKFKSTRLRVIQGFNRIPAWELKRAK